MKTFLRACQKTAVWLALTGPLGATASPARERSLLFDVTKDPATRDWQRFHQMGEDEREALWLDQARQGKKLADWAWGWRLGWVRVCTFSARAFCRELLETALFDKALVVRAEAAARLGDRFEDTHNPRVVALLAKAFERDDNSRNKKPMFVQFRILYALKQVGGPEAEATGARLSKRHGKAEDYWQTLSRR